MYKRIFFIIIILGIFLLSIMGALAYNEDFLYDRHTSSTRQFLVSITRPDGYESTFRRAYIICGNTEQEDIRVVLLAYNNYIGKYEPLYNTEGYSTWDIKGSGIFMKEFRLPIVGANMVRVIAYNKNNENALVFGENVQVSNFTITLLNRGIKDVIRNGLFRITDMLRSII